MFVTKLGGFTIFGEQFTILKELSMRLLFQNCDCSSEYRVHFSMRTELMKADWKCRTCSVDGGDVLPAEAMAEVDEDTHLSVVWRHDAHEVWKFLLVGEVARSRAIADLRHVEQLEHILHLQSSNCTQECTRMSSTVI